MRVRLRETSPAAGRRGKETKQKGGRQLIQLTVCLGLFLTVFIGKGAFPERVARVGPQLLGVLRANTDFRAAFADLGSTMTDGEGIQDGWKEFCVTVFGVGRSQAEESPAAAEEPVEVMQPEPLIPEESEPVPEPEPLPPEHQIGDVLETFAVEGEQLPVGYTYDRLYLGELETVDPVDGRLTSAFGYRDHPTIGRYAVHGGVDIGASSGSPVLAFADGTVEYVGESEDFGLYLRLRHENGLSTFYSHCQSIAVKKGQQVLMGQQVAQVGSTGKSTGPHLHFEIQLDEVRLDPMHYITTEEG